MNKKCMVVLVMIFTLLYSDSGGAAQQSFPVGMVVTKKDPLRIRKGPGTQYTIVGKAKKWEMLLIINDAEEWWKVQLQDETVGYAFKQYIHMLSVTSTLSFLVQNPPPIPYEDDGACPFEGCVYGKWVAQKETVIRQDRRAKAPVAFTVKRGETVVAETGVVVTLNPGKAKVIELVEIDGKQIQKDDIVYLYTYLGEGYVKIWFHGRMFHEGAEIKDFNPPRIDILEETESIWWVKMRNSKGQEGWTDEPDNFGNKDVLSGHYKE